MSSEQITRLVYKGLFKALLSEQFIVLLKTELTYPPSINIELKHYVFSSFSSLLILWLFIYIWY